MSGHARPRGARLHSFAGVGLRSLRARPLRSLLTTGGIVLGVGMVFGVLLLVSTIHGTFDRLFESVYSDADVVISGEQSIGSLPADTLGHVRVVQGVDYAVGSVGGVFGLVGDDGKVERGPSGQVFVAGVDFRQPDTTDAEVVAGREPASGREIEVARDWAKEHGIELGEQLRLAGPTGIVGLRVVGLYELGGGLDLGGYGTASMPIDAARPMMDKRGVWDEITVVAEDGTSAGEIQTLLRRRLGEGIDVSTPADKSDEANEQLASLDVVLYFFSGMALFVGAFLILNSFNMTVLQRLREIGTLRALGASRGRVVRSVLGEAMLLGIAGCMVGLALGFGLAFGLLEMMSSFGFPVGTVELSAGPALAAVVTGLVATAVGALWPAVRAGRIEPIRALTGGREQRLRPGAKRALAGVLLFFPGLIGGGLFWFSDTAGGGPLAAVAGVGGTFVMLVGMVLLAPFMVMPLVSLMSRLLRRLMPAEGRLAADSVQSNPGRTAATAAALIVALSVVVVNATIAQSFVGSVSDELDKRLSRDLTVQPIGFNEFGPPQTGISRELQRRIAALPEAAAVARRRSLFLADLPKGGTDGLAVAFDPAEWRHVDATEYEGASTDQAMRGIAAGGVAPFKAYADKRNIEVGDRLKLKGAGGVTQVPVVAIADTLDGGGVGIQMSLDKLEGVYGIRTDSQLAVKAASPDQRVPLEHAVERLLEQDYPALEAVSNADLKDQLQSQINQQFSFFNAIVAIAVLVGLLGIVNTLSMSVIERTRDIGVLRALGASRWAVRRTMADESLLISIAGTLAGIGAGLVVAFVWLYALRGSTFPGITFQLPVGTLLAIAVLGVVLGVLAAILPARRAAKLDPLTALNYE